MGRPPPAIPKGAIQERGFEDRLHPLDQRLLADPIQHGRDTQLSDAALGLWDLDPLHRLRPVCPLAELAVQEVQVELLACLKLGDGNLVDARTASILLHLLPGQFQILATEHLVDQRVDLLFLPLSPLRCIWVLWFHGLLRTGVGSFAQGTLQPPSTYSPLPYASLAQRSTGPSPSVGPFEPAGAAAPGSDPKPFALTSFVSSMPRSDSWHRIGWNFACAYIHTYRLVASGRPLCSPFARPFVCGCHSIAAIPTSWTIPGLPGSPIGLPPRVARTHRGTLRWNPHAFASIVQARPFPIFGRPVHPGDVSPRLRPGGSPQALRTPPHGERPALRSPAGGGSRSPLAVSGFRLCACVGFSIPASLRPVWHYPHLWISTWGLRLSGTSTHLTDVLPGAHYALC